jgi:transcriptional regulator with XRE-family HTH domain
LRYLVKDISESFAPVDQARLGGALMASSLVRYRDRDTLRDIGRLREDSPDRVLSIPEAIRACRKGRLTQDELALKASIGQSTLSQWENGRSTPDPNQLRVIEEVCDRPIGWILIQAGYIADVTTVPEAIAVAPELSDSQKAIIMDAYNAITRPR